MFVLYSSLCALRTHHGKFFSLYFDAGGCLLGLMGRQRKMNENGSKKKLNAKVICWCQDFYPFSVAFFSHHYFIRIAVYAIRRNEDKLLQRA